MENIKATELLRAIDAMVQEKVFSLEGMKAVEALRVKTLELSKELERVQNALASAMEENAKLKAEVSKMNIRAEEMKSRELSVAKREGLMVELEKAKAVAEAIAAAVKETTALVFRNLEVRESILRTVPVALQGAAGCSGYVTPQVETGTVTREAK